MEPISHLDIAVSDPDVSLAFYRGLLEPLGYVRESAIIGERGERVTYLGRTTGGGSLGIRRRQATDRDGGYDRYATGLHHLAFAAPSRDVVNERWRWLIGQNAVIESEPSEYDYAAGYYAVFFYDPDGIKLEIVHEPDDPIPRQG